MSNDQTIIDKVAAINALLESFGFDGDTAGASAEVEYVKVEEDGDTWPVGEWQVEDLIEEGIEIRHEISVSIWSQSAAMDDARDSAVEAVRGLVEELNLTTENESKGFRQNHGEATGLEATRFWVR
jgi:hypothetical protein